MRPLQGVVERATSRTVDIRLESGLLVHITNDHKLRKFRRVDEFFDYTHNTVVKYEPSDPLAEATEPTVVEVTDMVEDEASEPGDVPVAPPLVDSGALYQVCDGWWDSEEGVIIVEGE